MEKTVLLIINELGKKGGEKKGVTNLHLPSIQYNFEMAFLVIFGVFRDMGQKAVTDCDSMVVIGGMDGNL